MTPTYYTASPKPYSATVAARIAELPEEEHPFRNPFVSASLIPKLLAKKSQEKSKEPPQPSKRTQILSLKVGESIFFQTPYNYRTSTSRFNPLSHVTRNGLHCGEFTSKTVDDSRGPGVEIKRVREDSSTKHLKGVYARRHQW